jgi:hypothetical protein
MQPKQSNYPLAVARLRPKLRRKLALKGKAQAEEAAKKNRKQTHKKHVKKFVDSWQKAKGEEQIILPLGDLELPEPPEQNPQNTPCKKEKCKADKWVKDTAKRILKGGRR